MTNYFPPELKVEHFELQDVISVSNPIVVSTTAAPSTTQPTTGSGSVNIGDGGDGYVEWSDIFG